MYFKPGNFTLTFKKDKIRSFEHVQKNSKSKKEVLVDGREKEDFIKGKIPNSVNVPFSELFVNGTVKLKDIKQLRNVFESRGVKPSKSIIFSCLRGLKAAAMGFVADLLGFKKIALYPVVKTLL